MGGGHILPAWAGCSAPGTASARALPAAEQRRGAIRQLSLARLRLQGAAASDWSWGACTGAGGLQAARRAGGCVHARDRSIAHGVGTACVARVGRGMACLPFRKGDYVPEFLMLGYITAVRWGWGHVSILPGGWGTSVGLSAPRGTSAPGPCWRQRAARRLRVPQGWGERCLWMSGCWGSRGRPGRDALQGQAAGRAARRGTHPRQKTRKAR